MRHPAPAFTLIALASFMLNASALAQEAQPASSSPASTDLRRLQDELAAQRKETDALRIELADTRKQLAELKGLLADVKGLLDRLLKKSDTQRALPASPTAEPPAQLPADPFACPDCLLQELRNRYTARFGSALTPNDAPARRERLADINRWCRDVNHDLRGKTRWIVRIDSLKEDAGKLAATYTVLDPVSRTTLGSSRTDTIPAQFHARLKAAGPGAVYEVGLWAAADIDFNENRPDEGIFNVPLLVAPYVEWDMKAEWTSLESIEGDRKKTGDNNPR